MSLFVLLVCHFVLMLTSFSFCKKKEMVNMMKRMKHEKKDTVEMIGSGFRALKGTCCYTDIVFTVLIDRNKLVFPPIVVCVACRYS